MELRLPYIFFFLLLAFLFVKSDFFESADANHDGVLDRDEVHAQLLRFKNALEPLLDLNETEKNGINFQGLLNKLISSGKSFISGFINSLVVILVTEIGDKTFFIAAVLAMRNARLVVYLGSMTALAAMHILSSLMGFALPALLPSAYTHFASIVLFLYFGSKLLRDAYEMKNEGPSEELHEVEEELIQKKGGEEKIDSNDSEVVESGNCNASSSKTSRHSSENLKVFTQAMTLTFVAEWGDRSQIATIALAASKNILGVIVGGLIGHAFCTGLAVIGGRLLAARISERTVAICGGVLFLVFAVHSYVTGSDSI